MQSRSAIGDPAVTLIDFARELAADLIIVGRRGGDFVARTLNGRGGSLGAAVPARVLGVLELRPIDHVGNFRRPRPEPAGGGLCSGRARAGAIAL
jgi:hypothetical protein